MRNPVGLFYLWGSMYRYPKQILTIEEQVQSYIDAGMEITSRAEAEKALKSVGFYRLRGYSFHLYDNSAKKYIPGTKFDDIFQLYQFDQELSSLIFSMISKIEVALRVRLVAAYYRYISRKGNFANPSQKMFASWVQAVSVLRNMCAHNSRIYNRTIHTAPEILDADKVTPAPAHNGLYQILLAMNMPTDWKVHLSV